MSRAVRILTFDVATNSVAFSRDDPCLAVGLDTGTVTLCDPASGNVAHTFPEENFYNNEEGHCIHNGGHWLNIISVAFISHNGSLLLASASLDRTIKLWDIQTKKCIHTFNGHTKWVRSMALSPDSSLLASGSLDSTVRIWHVAARKAGPVLQGHTGDVLGVAFSSSGRLLVSGCNNGMVRLWIMPDGTPGPVLADIRDFGCVAFSPIAGSNLLSFSSCKLIQLWDVSGEKENKVEMKLVRTFQSSSNIVRSVTFSPDGSQLASGSYDYTVKLWKVANGTLLKTFTGHTHWVHSVAFHPSGHQLASASDDKTVRIWTTCEWDDRRHYLFGPELKRIVFRLMCVKARQEATKTKTRLPMQMWLYIFAQIALLN